jgi:hypothetical protein
MEFAIPITQFDSSKVRWAQPRSGPFRKTIPFTYEDDNVHFNNLIVALHPLKVSEIDYERNQLVLEENKKYPFLSKIDHFQNTVCSELDKRSKAWLDETKGAQPVKSPLQPWLKSGKLTLYLSDKPELLSFYTDEGVSTFSEKTVKPGDTIRAIVKIQGISLQMSETDVWTGKSRIQHHILQLYKVELGTTD